MREVVVHLEVLNKILGYLAERPYKEVVDLVEQLKTSVKELPKNEQKETAQEDVKSES